MKYMGGKSKIAKNIVPIIQERIDKYKCSMYIEPFVGGANIIDKIKCDIRIASDNNKYLIALYNNLDKIDNLPKEVSHEHYAEVRMCYNNKSGEFEDWYIGAIGFLASYNGRFFDGGYAKSCLGKDGVFRNYYNEAKNNLMAQLENLKGVQFLCCDYRNYNNAVKNCVIYCDPPYTNTKKYGTSKNFDYDVFWEWCRRISDGNIVLVSEQEAPNDFKCIWEKDVDRTINCDKNKKAVERLFEIG